MMSWHVHALVIVILNTESSGSLFLSAIYNEGKLCFIALNWLEIYIPVHFGCEFQNCKYSTHRLIRYICHDCDIFLSPFLLSCVAIFTPTDRPKSVHKRCEIEVFDGVCVLSRCFLGVSVGVGAFVIWLSQINSFSQIYEWSIATSACLLEMYLIPCPS